MDTVIAQIATYEAGLYSRELTSLAKLYTSNDLKYSIIIIIIIIIISFSSSVSQRLYRTTNLGDLG